METYTSAAGAPIVAECSMAPLWITACLSALATLAVAGVTAMWLHHRRGGERTPPSADHYCALDDLDL